MEISIIIPTFNNIHYLKILVNSIKKNSKYNHEIIVHVNEDNDGTREYLNNNNIKFTYSEKNAGLCSSVNNAAKLATSDYILYTHDDMYFLPDWDLYLVSELNGIKDNLFYFSGTMIQKKGADLILDCGDTYINFKEDYLLNNYNKINIKDHQGTHWAPHLIHKSIWNDVNGFSEEFNPGDGSDSDLNMKLWKRGVRLFKGINNFKVYHFGSISMRRKKNFIKNDGSKTFLKKWGITIKFFFKYYLKTGTVYNGRLEEPKFSLLFLVELFICKIKRMFV